MAQNSLDQVLTQAEGWFSKLPPLPKSWTDFIATIMPWVALLFGITGVIGSLRFITMPTPFNMMGGMMGSTFGIVSILYLVSSALLLASFAGLKAKKISGWKFLLWSEIANLISAIVIASAGAIIIAFVVFYVIFQIKHYYK